VARVRVEPGGEVVCCVGGEGFAGASGIVNQAVLSWGSAPMPTNRQGNARV